MLIQKCSYIKPGKGGERYLRYIATRDGVEIRAKPEPVTTSQQKLVQQIVKDFPDSRELFEYQDFVGAPTCANASAFISMALDCNVQSAEDSSGYLRYISLRPGVERHGAHGLFCTAGTADMGKVSAELRQHEGSVWTIIYSLNREDASRLGYTHSDAWRSLLCSSQAEMAKAMGIPLKHFRWCAAFHHPESHPHIHMMIWSADPKQGFVTHNGLEAMRSKLTNTIYHDELLSLYQEKNQSYQALMEKSRQTVAQLTQQLITGICDSPAVADKLLVLSDALKGVAGKKQYGYLPKPLKSIVDEVVDALSQLPEVGAAYDAWNALRDQQAGYYQNTPRLHLPLSRQKEFRTIKNAVIKEVDALRAVVPAFMESDMNDDPEPVEEMHVSDGTENLPSEFLPPGSDGTAPQTVYEQAQRYRTAKQILLNTKSPPAEQQMALQSLEQLWEEGYSIAAHLLGKCYRDGVGTFADTTLAVRWFRKSAEAGNDCSQYALGELLLQLGRPENAVPWLHRAASQGNSFAQYQLGKLYCSGSDAPKDMAFAIRCWKSAAVNENAYAQFALGRFYLAGKEIPTDRAQAQYWFTLSAAGGNPYAQFFLERMEQFRDPSVFLAATRLLHHLGQIFQDTPTGQPPMLHIDRKRRRQLMEKRLALGHKANDHEDAQNQTGQRMT